MFLKYTEAIKQDFLMVVYWFIKSLPFYFSFWSDLNFCTVSHFSADVFFFHILFLSFNFLHYGINSHYLNVTLQIPILYLNVLPFPFFWPFFFFFPFGLNGFVDGEDRTLKEEKKWDLRRDVTNFLYPEKVSCQECFPHSFESPMLMWTVFFWEFY